MATTSDDTQPMDLATPALGNENATTPNERPLKLMSFDETEIGCNVSDTANWSTLKDLIEDCVSNLPTGSDDQPAPVPEIPLCNNSCTAETMVKVLAFAKHYKGPDAKDHAKAAKDPKAELPPWDMEFFQLPANTKLTPIEELKPQVIFPIVMAANFLGYEHLLDSGCKAIASMIKGRTAEQIRKLFHIKNDFTPEEEAQLKLENEWCEDIDSKE